MLAGMPEHVWRHVLDVEPNRHLQQLGEVGVGSSAAAAAAVAAAAAAEIQLVQSPACTAVELTLQQAVCA
jgi:hypothetical protein